MKKGHSLSRIVGHGPGWALPRRGLVAGGALVVWLSFHPSFPLRGGDLQLQVPDLPREVGRSVALGIPGLPNGARKLEMVLMPGLGAVKPFLIGKYEITQGQYQTVTGTNPSAFKHGPDYPVEMMSWGDAKDFCAKLNEGLVGELRAKLTFRLPTDAEWSIAVGLPEESGSTPSKKSKKIKDVYPWGHEWPPPLGAGNYGDDEAQKKHGASSWISYIPGYHDGYADTAPVGSFQTNRFGICDLGGNVWEWCEDWIDEAQKTRVCRGASWFDSNPGHILSSYRGRYPGIRNSASGFRVVLEVPPLRD
jgi:formylglycine-generating enzyme required for sulfatase activity